MHATVYTIDLDEKGSEQILNETDIFLIELKKKYPIEVEA